MDRQTLTRNMEALADGERSAFRPVFDEAWPLARSLALRLVGEKDADDVAQQGLMKLLQQLDRYRPGTDPVPWILAIVGWEARTVLKRRQRKREDPLETTEPSDASPEPELLRRDLVEAAVSVAGTLSELDRSILARALDDDGGRPWSPRDRKRRQRTFQRLREAFWRIHD